MNDRFKELPKKCITCAMAEGRVGNSTGVLYLYTDSGGSARIFHDFLVRKYDPPYNKERVPESKERNNNKTG
jgi:hypothetical protein